MYKIIGQNHKEAKHVTVLMSESCIIHWTESVFWTQNYEKQLLLLGDVQWLNVLWLSAEIFLWQAKNRQTVTTSLKCNSLLVFILLIVVPKGIVDFKEIILLFNPWWRIILKTDTQSDCNYPTELYIQFINNKVDERRQEWGVSNGLPMPSLWLVRWS